MSLELSPVKPEQLDDELYALQVLRLQQKTAADTSDDAFEAQLLAREREQELLDSTPHRKIKKFYYKKSRLWILILRKF